MQKLELLVVHWAEDRKLLPNSKVITQALKLGSEVGELARHLRDHEDITDDLGDILVVLIILYKLEGNSFMLTNMLEGHVINPHKSLLTLISKLGELQDEAIKRHDTTDSIIGMLYALKALAFSREIDLKRALETAYEDIKDRKGITTKEGVFIKDTDPRYEEAVANDI